MDTELLNSLLDGLCKGPLVRCALLASTDGLVVAKSSNMDQDMAERTAAGSSSMLSTSRALAEFAVEGEWSQVAVDFKTSTVFVIAAGESSLLLVSVAAPAGSPQFGAAHHAALKLVHGLGSEVLSVPDRADFLRSGK